MAAEELATRKSDVKTEAYSVSLLAAISHEEVMASQLIEGGVDGVVFENFIGEMLRGLSSTLRSS
jgi:predicted TIM-barrel enzyme